MAKKRKDPSPPKQPSSPESEEVEEEVEEEFEEVEEEASGSEAKDGEASESESESEHEPEEEQDLSNRETLRNIIIHFPKEQLVQLLTESLPRHPDLLSKITQSSKSDPSHRRIFVYGLGWDCTTQTLIDTFQKYGTIAECKAVLNHVTNQCKGYGFVLFSTRSAANKALKEPTKVIGNRTASCQLASKGNPRGGGGVSSTHMPGSDQGGAFKGALPSHTVQTSAGSGYVPQPQVNTALMSQGYMAQPQFNTALMSQGYVPQPQVNSALMTQGSNRSVTSGQYDVNSAMRGLYGVNGGVSQNLFGVNSVSPSVIGNYQSQTALQRMGVNSMSPSVIGSYQSQGALQGGLGGHLSQSSPEEPKTGLLPCYRR